MHSRSRPWGETAALGAIAVVILFAPVLQAAGGSSSSTSATAGSSRSAERQAARRPYAVFVGDNYTAGTIEGGNGPAGFPSLVASKLGWDQTVVAADGVGWAKTNQNQGPFGQLITEAISVRPDILVVFGSRNDTDPAAAGKLAASNLLRVRKMLPKVTLIVVAPPWVGDQPSPTVIADRSAVKAAAVAARAQLYVDPISDGWFAGQYAKLIGSDGVNPTDAGHQRMAQLLEQDIRRAGLQAGVGRSVALRASAGAAGRPTT